MAVILDTNLLIDFPQFVIDDEREKIILTDVLRELDGLKKHLNPDIAERARRAAIYIARKRKEIEFDNQFEDLKISVDDKIIKAAELRKNACIITNDIYLKIKAEIKGIQTESYGGIDDYSGLCYWKPDFDENLYNKELEDLLENRVCPNGIELCENQYLIVQGADDEEIGIFKKKEGKIDALPRSLSINNKWIGTIFPRNTEQKCLFDSLIDQGGLVCRRNSIIYAGGEQGVGKSFILNNYALQELEKGRINKIVYIPNNSFTENTIDIGAMPGDLLPKTIGQIGPLIDLVGIDYIERMQEVDKLEIVPMSFIRGRSFNHSIIIVNEAQNLTEDHIKLLIARCGEGTRIFFDGDLKQADSQLFRNKSGLKLLLTLRKSPTFNKMFSTVKLKAIERSKTAQAARFLDEQSTF